MRLVAYSLRICAAILIVCLGLLACTSKARLAVNGLKESSCRDFAICPELGARMKFHSVPGLSIAIVHQGKVAFAQGFGVKAQGFSQSIEVDTLFQACSISKPFAAFVALEQVKEGSLQLDRDVNHYLTTWKVPENEFTKIQPVTLRSLLNHTAGFRAGRGYDFVRGAKIPTLLEVLEGKYDNGSPLSKPAVVVEFVPGSRFQYSTTGYAVLQQVLEDAKSIKFSDMGNQLLGKLGMYQSTFAQPLPEALFAKAAHAHDAHGKPYPEDWYVMPEVAAAGLWTTAGDLARAILAIQASLKQKGQSAIDPLILKEMLNPYFDNFGLGIKTGGEGNSQWFSHGGDNKGYKALMVGYANIGEGIVVLSNSDEGFSLALEIFKSVAKNLGWPEFENIGF